MKSQRVRLVDVFALGPFMVWYGLTTKRPPGWARTLMVVAGVATVLYNARNYLLVEGETGHGRAPQSG